MAYPSRTSSPSVPQHEGTRRTPRTGTRLRYASNGSVRARATSSGVRYDVVIVHKALTLAARNSVVSFVESNRATTFDVTFEPDGSTRTCVFAEKAFDETPAPGGLWDMTVYMVQST